MDGEVYEHIRVLEQCCERIRDGEALVTTDAFAELMGCLEFWEFMLRLARLDRKIRETWTEPWGSG
jgi:hypothetical protein